MIKLQRGGKPKYLTKDKEKQLTQEYKDDNTKAVWKSKQIGNALLKSSAYKCAYCECQLQRQDSYMQVEHFKDKDTYPDDVVKWDNLLPSCSRCNRKKWTLDVITSPIVNPYIDDPRIHLKQQAFRLYPKDLKGETTITKLFLNDDDRVVYPRFLAANEINKQLSELINDTGDFDRKKNGVTRVLQSCQADKPYSAFISHALHSNQDYLHLKEVLITNGLWDTDLVELHEKSLILALEPR